MTVNGTVSKLRRLHDRLLDYCIGHVQGADRKASVWCVSVCLFVCLSVCPVDNATPAAHVTNRFCVSIAAGKLRSPRSAHVLTLL